MGSSGSPKDDAIVGPEPGHRVLIISTYERFTSSTTQQEDAIASAIRRAVPYPIIRSDYLIPQVRRDRDLSSAQRRLIAEGLRLKWSTEPPTLIVTIDTLAFDLMTSEGAEVFPGRPIVFSGVTWPLGQVQERLRSFAPGATGVLESVDVPATVRLIQQLLPSTQRVHVICRARGMSEGIEEHVKSSLTRLTAPPVPKLTVSSASTSAQLIAEVDALPDQTTIVYVVFAVDEQSSLDWNTALKLDWKRPTFVVFESNTVEPFVGGRVISPAAAGRVAGKLAARVLNGEQAGSIPVQVDADKITLLRSSAMTRAGIQASRVPPGSIVVDPPAPWTSRNQMWLLMGTGFAVIQTPIILAMIINRRRRLTAQAEGADDRQRLQLAVEGSNLSIWDWDIAEDQIRWTGPMQDSLSASTTERQGVSPWRERLHPEDEPRTMKAVEAHLVSGARYDVEYRLRQPDGQYRWYRSRGSAAKYASGKPVRMLGTLTDVHERVVISQRVLESEARYRKIVETAHEGIWVVDAQWRTTFVNRRMAELLRTTAEAMISRHIFDFMDDAGRAEAAQNMSSRQEGRDAQHEFRFVRADGEDLYAIVSTNAILDEKGQFSGAMALITDVSAIKQTERSLRREQALFLAGPAVAWRWKNAPGFPVGYVSENVSAYGYGAEDFISGRIPFVAILHPDDVQRVEHEVTSHVLAGDSRFTQEYRVRHADGRWLWLRDYSVVERDATGTVTGFSGYTIEATRERAAEQFRDGQRRILEQIATDTPLADTLASIVRVVDDQDPELMSSILLLDEDRRARAGATLRLPKEYCQAIEGFAIGPESGSCGTAMYYNRRVVCQDIAVDPLWSDFRERAMSSGLRACWSQPIVGSAGKVLGALAMYYATPRLPTTEDLDMISVAAHLAGIAIDARRREDDLRTSQATTQALLEAMPDLLFRMDRNHRYLSYHGPDPRSSSVRLVAPPSEFLGKRPAEILPKVIAEPTEHALKQLFETNQSQSFEYEIEREGTIRDFEVRAVASGSDEALVMVRDITQRKLVERRLRESQQRLKLLVDNAPFPVTLWDSRGVIQEWNREAEVVFGWTAQEAIGQPFWIIVPESERAYVSQVYKNLLANKSINRGSNLNVRKDGRIIHAEWYNTPLVNDAGEVFAVASMVRDTTEELENKRRERLLMAELDHRVKNNMATVVAIAEQTGPSASSYEQFLRDFSGRLRALARMHSSLAAQQWRGAWLQEIVQQTTEAFGKPGMSQFRAGGPELMLDAQFAQAIAMSLNELATNAAKYGALSVPDGRITVLWTITGTSPPMLELVWQESGGPTVRLPDRRSFGSTFVEGVVSHELNGAVELSFDPAGVRCTIRVPLHDRPLPEDPAGASEARR